MALPRSISGDLAVEILLQYPTAPIKQLGRILYEKNPAVFKDAEAARTILRYYGGSLGKKNHAQAATPELYRDRERGQMLSDNPFGLPKSRADHWRPVPFPIKKGRGAMMYDEHIPYQDNRAITTSVRWFVEHQYTDFVLFGGDLIDCYQLSPFVRDPRKRKFKQDLEDLKKFFDAMRRAFPNALFIWKEGNHEKWEKLYLQLKAPEIFELDGGEWVWDDYLDLKGRGIVRIDEDVPLTVGKLNIIHGHELRPTNNTVNAARGAYMKALECIILGHWHRTSEHAETSFSGRLDTAWGVGCLCNLHPDYARINKWNHGFAGLEVDGSDFAIENKRIVKGLVR